MRKILAISTVWLLPALVFAQEDVFSIFQKIDDIVNYGIYILFTVATAVFLWGMVKYVMAGGDEKAKEASKGFIKSGIIGLFLMVAIWGIIAILAKTFGVDKDIIPSGPGYENVRPKIETQKKK